MRFGHSKKLKLYPPSSTSTLRFWLLTNTSSHFISHSIAHPITLLYFRRCERVFLPWNYPGWRASYVLTKMKLSWSEITGLGLKFDFESDFTSLLSLSPFRLLEIEFNSRTHTFSWHFAIFNKYILRLYDWNFIRLSRSKNIDRKLDIKFQFLSNWKSSRTINSIVKYIKKGW